mgnify:FL=1
MNKKSIVTAASGLILPLLLTACVHTPTFVSQGRSKAVTSNNEYLHLASIHPARISPNKDEMRVTLLGTGSPVPSEQRFGMSTLVQAGGYNLVFDAGRGAVIRLTQAGILLGKVDGVFLTHYHSDHVNGLSDMWMTGYIPAFGGRQSDFNVYGPTGVLALVEGLKIAHADDIRVRVADGELKKDTTNIVAHEFSAEGGVVFNQNGVVVTAFKVEHDHHGAIQPALGYRVDYAGRAVVISGDTIPTANVLKYGKGVDLLIHEVAEFQDTHAVPQVYAHQTKPREAGEMFKQTEPKMAVYSHIVNGVSSRIIGIPDEVLIQRTKVNYQGPLVVGRDLMSFLLTPTKIDTYTP